MIRFRARYLIILIGVIIFCACQAFDPQQYFSLECLKTQHAFLVDLYARHPILTLFSFFLLLLVLTASSIPGLSVVILAGGSVFSFPLTLITVSFADVIGSVLAFLGSRFLFGYHLQKKYSDRLHALNQGISRDGAYYLLSLRLIPIVPCFMINLMVGLTRIRIGTFYWTTQIGKLPHNAIYANAGTQLGKTDSLLGILSPEILISFCLIGLFPLLAKRWLTQTADPKIYTK